MTAPHYGKREPGALTAASPGDTLYFNFASYNDSGDSEALTGFAVTDIEVLKNGSATVRATDSGYSLISDTGMVGDRAGLYRFSIQLYNTADDANFYASGSWYQVFVDAVTIDGKTVRHWCGSFEIGRQRVNIHEIGADTGAASYLRATFANGFADTGINDSLGRIRSDVDTGLRVHIDDLDTGLHAHISDVDTGIHSILQTVGVLVSAFSDTGVNNRLDKIQADVDTGLQNSDILRVRGDTGAGQRLFRFLEKLDTGGDLSVPQATVDTGLIAAAIWSYGGRKLLVDTGIADQVWMQTRSSYTTDTGTFGEHLGGSLGTAVVDTGVVNQAVWQGNATRVLTANTNLAGLAVNMTQLRGDTGGADRFYRYTQKLDTGGDATVSASVDTGQVNNAVWNGARTAHTSAGTFGQYVNSNLVAVLADTGAAHLDAGRLGVSASAVVDTGVLVNAVWDADQNQHADTGLPTMGGSLSQTNLYALGTVLELSLGVNVASIADTGIEQRFDRIQADVDTGLRAQISDLDTGIHDTLADYDTGVRAILALQDTGAVANAVWNFATRSITASSDTGINDRLAKILADTDTGIQSSVNLTTIRGDTGAADRLLKLTGSQLKADGTFDTGTGQTTNTFNVAVTANVDTGQVSNSVWNSLRSAHTGAGSFGESDTGINSRLTAVQTKTDRLTFDTGNEILADIRKVNQVTVQGTGDTGTADTWRPA
jgi:hypothetical protein